MNPMPSYKKMAGLQYVEAGNTQSQTKIIFCHGYGANALDLYPLHSELAPGGDPHWIFPQGPLSVPIAPGYQGQAWFSIRAEALQLAAATGKPLDFSQIRPPGMTAASEQLLRFLEALGADPKNCVLGGFSQGSMLALDTALTTQLPWKGLVLFSSTLTDASNWSQKAQKLEGQTFLQSHGKRDELLPFGEAVRLKLLLEEAGWSSHWIEFSGGHEIPYQVLVKTKEYLQRQITR